MPATSRSLEEHAHLRAPRRAPRRASVVLALAVLVAVLGPALAPHDPLAIPADPALQRVGPSAAHWLGTDPLGRDIASRLLAGARYTLGIASAAMAAALAIGATIGTLAALLGRRGERILLRGIDTCAAVPRVVVLIAAAGFAGASSPWRLVLLLAIVSWFELARLVHRSLRQQLAEDRIAAARALGVPTGVLVRDHLLPSVRGLMVVWASAEFGQLILAETGLSFLGVGIPAPLPSWGRVLLETGDVLGPSRWLVLGPGLLITATVSAAFSVADRLPDESARSRVL